MPVGGILFRLAVELRVDFESPMVGVGKNEDPSAEVWGTHGGRGNNRPFRIEPERGQVAEDTVESSNKESCDVLHDDVSGSKNANGADVLSPQS
jgi:hypothetical protein